MPDKELLKLNELLDGKYLAKSTWNGTWISDNEMVFINDNKEFTLYNAETDTTKVLVHATHMKDNDVSRAILSPSGKYVLFISDIRGVFRHSSLAQYKIFDITKE